jgi:Uncharacterized conserved protein
MKRTPSQLRRILLLFLVLACHSACRSASEYEVQVLAEDGSAKAEFDAEYAIDPAARAQGLMFRRSMGANQAMFFIFEADSQGPFWMRNTLIPLDIIFIDTDKKIVNIVTAAPQTDTPRLPTGPYRYVLEINGGRAEKLGIKPGDRVEFENPR